MTFVVTLTGGIASGKSTVAQYFQDLGVPIIDADLIAKELVQPQTKSYQAICDHFGPTILKQDQTLDRAKLRQLIFSNNQEKQWLENLLHPQILQTMQQRIMTFQYPYCICVIPLFAETKTRFATITHRVLVIDCPVDLQKKRLKQRDDSPAALIENMIAAQASREARLALADDVIENDQNLTTLKDSVYQKHLHYLQQATELDKS